MVYVRDTFKTVTSRILVFVIFISDAPYAVMVYMVMYLQYSGLSDIMAGIACAVGLMGGVVGGVGGGFAIDGCHKLNEKYGRLLIGVLLLFLRLISASLLLWHPLRHGRMEWYHYVQVSLIGATLVTPQSIDRPILSAIVADKVQAVALSLNRVVAGIPSSLTFVPLIGVMAEKLFGYVNSHNPENTTGNHAMLVNATALRKAMLYVTVVATVVNILLYLAMLLTYPNDANNNSPAPKK
ncbi:hypothetical protein BgAZ_200020 [Babesia gibsoni]|uniref:Uncharacterized protein n=1 Tax=Babesia gibsoni TaxID=33632 RepID=A0AAD8LQN9_BABGI|nr:hypothetical protein BgAZ_200020 [Babesia gibsoni]